MKKLFVISFILGLLSLSACTSSKKAILPFDRSVEPDDAYTIIWNGISKAYRYENGQWKRAETYDYQFNVVQKRYDDRWKSVKTLHRIHPDYDGKAGNRNQTMYFEVVYKSFKEGQVQSEILSSLGNGTGTSDTEFRDAELTMRIPNPSGFMPYNAIRIKQRYAYEQGVLTETVELFKEKDGQEIPFMKNEEMAWIFVKAKLDKAPTIYKGL